MAEAPAGYLLDAVERLDGKPSAREEIDAFVASISGAVTSRQPSAGLGEDVRLRGERLVGSGLELEGETIQLSAFRSDDGGLRVRADRAPEPAELSTAEVLRTNGLTSRPR